MEDAAVRAVPSALEGAWLPCAGVAFTGHPQNQTPAALPLCQVSPNETVKMGKNEVIGEAIIGNNV